MLNEVLREAMALHHPPAHRGRELKLHYLTQVAVKPPTFALWVNDPELVHFSYQRYLRTGSGKPGFKSPRAGLRRKKRGTGNKVIYLYFCSHRCCYEWQQLMGRFSGLFRYDLKKGRRDPGATNAFKYYFTAGVLVLW